MALKYTFHSYALDSLLLQPFSPPFPSLSPLSPPLSFPSFPFFLPSEAFRSSFRTKKRSLGQRQPLLQQALTLAPLGTLARPPASLVPPETVTDVAVPRPLSVEQIAAPSPTELLPSRFQIAREVAEKEPILPTSFCDGFQNSWASRVAVRLPILPSG